MTKRDYYEVLGVERDATLSEIKLAFRQKAQKYHPDLNRGATSTEHKFKEINQAYEVLRDPAKRETYDQFGHQGLENQGGFSNDPFSSFGASFENIFADFFGGASRSRQQETQQEYIHEVVITLQEAFTGKTIQIEMPYSYKCPSCSGTGAQEGHSATCSRCGGQGFTQVRHAFINIRQTCRACGGSGSRTDSLCKKCSGSGHYTEYKKTAVTIPQGVEDNSYLKLRVKNNGNISYLQLQIRVKQDKRFLRQGSNLLYTLPITMVEACLGAKKTIHGLDEQEINLSIPEGVQYGQLLTVPGQGMPALGSKTKRGNLTVKLEIVTPRKLSQKQKELLQRFAQNG